LQKEIKSIGVQGLLFIGFAQALAIIPGISRAGITIAAGLFTGLKREEAAKLSFLMAPPVILGAGLLMMTKLAISDLRLSFFIGFLSAAVFGLLAIKFLLTYLKKAKLSLFIVYRLILGIIIIILTLCRII
jgi:undecaprenyl-diphosphatase